VSVIQERDPRAAAGLPDLVSRYVERNVSPDTLHRQRVRFSQVGEMQLKPGRWSPFRAEQEVVVEAVGFIWRATFRPVPFVPLRVRDWYRAGAAGLDVRLWGLLPVVHARGREIARGEAIRYLVELPMAPQAMAGNAELEWRAVDESTVEVTTLAGGERVVAALRRCWRHRRRIGRSEAAYGRQAVRRHTAPRSLRRIPGVRWRASADYRGSLVALAGRTIHVLPLSDHGMVG
jgi:hypothetical protein